MTRAARKGWRSRAVDALAAVAESVGEIPGLLAGTIRRAQAANVPALAAAIAFHALLSLAPLLLLLLTAASLILGSEAAQVRLQAAIESLGDPALAAPLLTMVEMIVDSRGSILATAAGALIMIYFASAVFQELGAALDAIWGVPPRSGLRGLFLQRLIALVIVPGAVAVGILFMAATVLNALLSAIVEHLLPGVVPHWMRNPGLLQFLLTAGLLALLYRYGPRAKVHWCDVRTGAAVTALAFTLGNAIMEATLRKSVLASLYGAAGAVVVLLLWIFYSAHILLIGACFTREYAERFGSRCADRSR